jgi:hypothetical protein
MTKMLRAVGKLLSSAVESFGVLVGWGGRRKRR